MKLECLVRSVNNYSFSLRYASSCDWVELTPATSDMVELDHD